MLKDKNIKSTCNEIIAEHIRPEPAVIVAQLTNTSASYVNKLRRGARNDKTETAAAVKYCEELILDGKKMLLQTVSEILNKEQSPEK